MAEAANSAPRRRQRRLELGSGEPGTPGPDEDADDSRAGSWRARRQLLPPMGEADAGAARPPAIAAADGAADADGADLGLRADAGRSRRRRQADGAAESAAASAGGAVRKALERISPRRRPAEETELLQLMPDKEDVLSQRGGGALGEADASQPFGGLHGGGEAGRAAAATWVEDAATGAFRRAAEPGSGAGRGRGSLGLARAGERGPTERMAVLAERARALLSAALGLCEGVLAGMCGLHALVAEECARRPFLVAGYLRAARATHQAFHLLCTMALLSALVAMGSAGLSLERLERADQGWERAAAYREAGRQQAAAALAALLYAAALVCSLLAVRAAAAPAPPRASARALC